MEKEKIDILKDCFGNYFKTGEEHLFQCPKCQSDKRKLSVNVEKNVFKCWVCGYSGLNIANLLKRHAPYSEYSRWLEITETVDLTTFDNLFDQIEEETVDPIVQLPGQFKTLTSRQEGLSYRYSLNYLKQRGIDKGDALRWKIGYCDSGEYEKRICIPSFGESGQLNYFVARSYAGQFPKYKNPPVSRDIIFNDLYVDWDEPIVLVEGAFDAIKAENSIPLLGSSLNENSKLFKKIIEKNAIVYMALDKDASSKERQIIKKLMEYDIEVYKIDTTTHEDVGEMTEKEFKSKYKEATVMNSSDYLYQCLKF